MQYFFTFELLKQNVKLRMVERLIRRIKDHDRQAMAELYQQFVGLLSSVCYRYVPSDDDAKDVLQNSFIKIFTAISSFKYQNDNSFLAWMKRVVTNEALDFLKNRKRITFVDINDNIQEKIEEEQSVELLSADDLHQLITELPDGYRTVLNLFVFEGYSHKEIAQLLGIKESSSASQFFHAKRMLEKKINDLMEEKNGKGVE